MHKNTDESREVVDEYHLHVDNEPPSYVDPTSCKEPYIVLANSKTCQHLFQSVSVFTHPEAFGFIKSFSIISDCLRKILWKHGVYTWNETKSHESLDNHRKFRLLTDRQNMDQ